MNDEPVYKFVDEIEFGMFSPKEIKEMAAAKVVTPELYDKEGYPVDGGLMDIRMGVIDPGLVCKTDGQKMRQSTGHFGYIELARPVVHVKFNKVIKDLLRCTCSETGRVLLTEEEAEEYREELRDIEEKYGEEAKRKRVKEIIKKLRKVNESPHTGEEQEKITLDKPTTYKEGDRRLSPIEIRAWLEKITDEDLELFGINADVVRPEWMVLTVLPIPPVPMRPSITLESGERSEDDLTHKLGDVVRINQRLFENINAGAPEIIIEDLWDLLQYHVTTFFDNNQSQLPPARHRSGQPLKTLTGRIKGKQGRIRNNLTGKRTNFSARTVISPDPMLGINEVGVPKTMAMKLSVPERVTEWNIDYLKKFVERGPDEFPGANYVVMPDGRRKRITDDVKEVLLEELEPGFKVERHLMDGDISLFNRQPSLHRMSMMCHKVRVLPGKTLRLNPAVCAPYNADFDGDEMNLHIPQTEEARAEAEILMEVQTQLISPRYGLSIIGCIQDAISGNYLLTKHFTVTKKEAVDLLAAIGIDDFSTLPDEKVMDGKQVFSALLPDDFNFTTEVDDDTVVIEDGEMQQGYLNDSNLGVGSGLLLRRIHKRYGEDKAVDILGNIYKLGLEVLTKFGFTSGISDIDLSDEAETAVTDILDEAESDVHDLVETFENNELDLMPGKDMEETLEIKILERLNKARNEAGKVVAAKADQDSHTMTMVKSGARGNFINVAQMSGTVGQQALRGGRIDYGYDERTISAFEKNDLGPAARGFIRSTFKQGLEPHELFFMAMTGRDSLMDTALRTPKSGYLYRRLSNALQDLKVEYDFTVREGGGSIVQFNYGEDGIDVSKSEGGEINVEQVVNKVIE